MRSDFEQFKNQNAHKYKGWVDKDVWLRFVFVDSIIFALFRYSDILLTFVQIQGLLMHPQITPYRSFNFTRDLLVPLLIQLRR